MPSPFPHAGEAVAVANSLLWAVAGILFARIRPPVTAGALNLGKNLTAVLGFAALFLVLHGRPWPARTPGEAAAAFAASGIVGLTLCDTFFLRALLTIGPQRATLFMALAPVLTALAAMLPPFRQSPAPLAWAGMLLCVAGIGLAALRTHPDPVRAATLRRGARNALVATVFQAGGALLSRQGFAAGGTDAGEAAMIRLAAGVLGLVALGAAAGRLRGWTRQLVGPGGRWRQVAPASTIGTFLGIWGYMAAIAWAEHTGVVVTLSSLAPVFLIPLSAAFLHERQDLRAWLATLVALAGIALLALS